MGVGVHAGFGCTVLKVIPDIISQWEQEERGDVNHFYTLSKYDKEIGSNAFCLSSVLVSFLLYVSLFLPFLSIHMFFPVIQEIQSLLRGGERIEKRNTMERQQQKVKS